MFLRMLFSTILLLNLVLLIGCERKQPSAAPNPGASADAKDVPLKYRKSRLPTPPPP